MFLKFFKNVYEMFHKVPEEKIKLITFGVYVMFILTYILSIKKEVFFAFQRIIVFSKIFPYVKYS